MGRPRSRFYPDAPAAEKKQCSSEPLKGANLPRNWQEIGLGDLVVAQQSREDGWYEVIVVEANGDMLMLRWRDYPRERRMSAIGFPSGRGTFSQYQKTSGRGRSP